MVVAVAGLVAAVAALWVGSAALGRPADAAAQARSAAETLAKVIEKAESEQWRRLTGGGRRPIDLRYTLHTAEPVAVPTGTSAPPPGGSLRGDTAATVPDIAAYYRATHPARLVVTGAPGAGKTALALELLLALLEERGDGDRVPVRVPLSGWDTRVPLDDFLVGHLVSAYDWDERRARQLADHGLLLPVLDGLDEMDPGLTSRDHTPLLDAEGREFPNPWAPRARAALQQLDAYSAGRDAGPLVLTCRSTHYDVLAADDRLSDAARIEIDPVTPAEALHYLAERFGSRARWGTVLRHLGDHPDGTLAHSLDTPWRLSLVATVYQRDGDPGELLGHATPQELDEHLLGRLIAATHALNPPDRGYTPEQIHTWLSVLARHLSTPGTDRRGRPGPATAAARTDIHLHELWPTGGARRVAWADAAVSIVATIWPLLLVRTAPEPLSDTVGVLAAVLVVALAQPAGPAPPSRWVFLSTLHFLRSITLGALGGAALGAVLGLLPVLLPVSLPAVPLWLLVTVLGALMGAVAGLLRALRTRQDVVSPGTAIRTNALQGVVVGLGLVTVFAVSGVALAASFAATLGVDAPSYRLLLQPTSIASGVGAGLLFAAASRRYAVFLLCTRTLPFRLNAFLTYAYEAGLLRLSGSAYQFRHRELQLWLTEQPPRVRPRAPSAMR